jgi:hypothetical protein
MADTSVSELNIDCRCSPEANVAVTAESLSTTRDGQIGCADSGSATPPSSNFRSEKHPLPAGTSSGVVPGFLSVTVNIAASPGK